MTVSSGYNRSQSPSLGRMAGRERASAFKEFTLGIVIAQPAARLRGPRALAGSLQDFNYDHAVGHSLQAEQAGGTGVLVAPPSACQIEGARNSEIGQPAADLPSATAESKTSARRIFGDLLARRPVHGDQSGSSA